ncbi:MAG: hypothetical protein LBU13_09100 [Synergistaceae bacterium]|nr:hypothetical protein [Synergistaceae bacterium]
MKRTSRLLLALFFLACSAGGTWGASRLVYEIELPFEKGAAARAVLPGGEARELGRVVELPEQTRWPSYTASAWGRPGTVTASAVNAVHILMSIESGQGRTMSVLPRETIAPAAGPGAAIILDCAAGTSFFGAWAPPAGTRITVKGRDSEHPLEDRLPSKGETLVFKVYEEDISYMADFENRPGGRVIAWERGAARVIARVIRPLGGVGRFEGTMFQWRGRIRANHAGVIDISTSDYGTVGGFQIIPWDHALHSKEMQGAWGATQWMIIAPPDGKSMLGGTAPLFEGSLAPGPSKGERLWDLWSTYGRKSLVLARIGGGGWKLFPGASGKADDALMRVTHIRIYFPQSGELPSR